MNIEYFGLTVIILVIAVSLRGGEIVVRRIFEQTPEQDVGALNRTIQQLQVKIRNLEAIIDLLIERVQESSLQLAPLGTVTQAIPDLGRQVLLICGDEDFCAQDRNALRKAGISFRRLRNATSKDLEREMRRRRADSNVYPFVHFAAHGSATGIKLDDGYVSGNQLSEYFDGVKCVFLDTCSNTIPADQIADTVDYVIAIYEDVDTEVATAFAAEFYGAIVSGMDIPTAYTVASAVVTDVREYVDLRIKD